MDESLEGALEMLPLIRDLSNRVNDDWKDLAENHIIIHVESVRLSNEVSGASVVLRLLKSPGSCPAQTELRWRRRCSTIRGFRAFS